MANQQNVIRAALFTPGLKGRWGLPMILWGEPGIAKSSILASIAEENGLGFHDTIASICEPAELAGYPVPNEDRTMVTPLPAPWIHAVNSFEGGGLQLFDEATSCSSAAHAALMRIVLEGKAGDVAVDPRVRFMMAANPVDCAANANELAIPLANRFGHLQFSPGDASDWIEWLQGGSVHSAEVTSSKQIEDMVMAKWDNDFAAAKGLVGAFIGRNASKLHKMPSVNDGESSLAWPSRRTWEMATRAYASASVHGLSDAERHVFVAAFIGTGPATELLAYARDKDMPDPVALLDGEVAFSHKKSRLDRTLGVLGGCAAFLLSTLPENALEAAKDKQAREGVKQWLSRHTRFYELCSDIIDAKSSDTVVPSVKMLMSRKLDLTLITKLHKAMGAKVPDPLSTPAGMVHGKLKPMVKAVSDAKRKQRR